MMAEPDLHSFVLFLTFLIFRKEMHLLKVYLESDIIKDPCLSDRAILAYVGLMVIIKKGRTDYLVSLKQLGYGLNGSIDFNRYFAKDLSSGLIELDSSGFIKIISAIGKSEYLLDLSDLQFETASSFFIAVDDKDFQKVCSCDCDERKLLRYYLLVLDTLVSKARYDTFLHCDLQKDVGYMPQSYFIAQLSISQKSLYTYNKLLQDRQLLHIYQPKKLKSTPDGLKSFNPLYGRYEHREKIETAGTDLVNSCKSDAIKKVTAKETKSLSNKFRYIRDEGKTYDDKTMEKIYFAMVKQNRMMKDHFDADGTRRTHTKNLSAFKDYKFYKGDLGIDED